MDTASRTVTTMAMRSLTGVRQRVILVVLMSVLAVATQSSQGGFHPNGAEGELDIAIEIGGERLGFACRGSGHATVLFLAGGGLTAISFHDEAQDGAAALTRVCTLDMTGVDAPATWLTPANADQIATDLNQALAGQQVPAPYVLVATLGLEPVSTSFMERSDGLVNGTLLIDPAPWPVTGWATPGKGPSRIVTLETIEHVLLAIRSLVWPPAA